MSAYLFSFLGVVLQEVLHWYDLKQDLKGNVKITNNLHYWLITCIVIIVFSLITPTLLEPIVKNDDIQDWHYIIGAFALPSVIKKLVKVLIGNNRNATDIQINKVSITSFSVLDYFK